MLVFYTRRTDIRNTIFQMLYISRIILRWRQHFPCIFRWLSPLAAEQHTTCPLCGSANTAALMNGKEQREHVCTEGHGVGIFL